jgi:hypothetical protein
MFVQYKYESMVACDKRYGRRMVEKALIVYTFDDSWD